MDGFDPTSTRLGRKPLDAKVSLLRQQNAEAELLRILGAPGDYTTRADWRDYVRDAVAKLRTARADHHAAWMAFCASRALPIAAE